MTSVAKKIIIGLAIAGVAGLLLIGIIAGAGVSGWRAATRAGNEAATLQNMKTIAAVEAQYFISHNRTFGGFEQLIKEKMLSSKFAGDPPLSDGYAFDLRIDGSSYKLNADPIDDTYGTNHFYIDSNSSLIHVNPDQPAGPDDPSN